MTNAEIQAILDQAAEAASAAQANADSAERYALAATSDAVAAANDAADALASIAQARAALDPPPPPPPPVSVWPYARKLGIADGSNPPQHTLDMMKALGAGVPLRIDCYALGGYAAPIGNCIAQGIPVLGIMYGTFPYGRAPDSVGNPAGAPQRYTPEWAGYVAGVYKGKVPLWEIMNEPDGQGWSPAYYASFAVKAALQIESADPAAKISTGGIYKSTAGISVPEFTRAIVAELHRINRLDLFDFFAVHPYSNLTNIVAPDNQWHMTFKYGDRALGDTMREILDVNGLGLVEIISTEYGTRFPGSEQFFADETGRKLDMVKSGWLAAGFHYRLDGTRGGDLDTCLTTSSGAHRLAYDVFKAKAAA